MILVFKTPVDRNGNTYCLVMDDEKKTMHNDYNVLIVDSVDAYVRNRNELKAIEVGLKCHGYRKEQ